jgi:restriction endonuclease S subunit
LNATFCTTSEGETITVNIGKPQFQRPQEQDNIAAILKSIVKNVADNKKLFEKHQQIKQALMSDLLMGKIRAKYEEEKAEVM